MKKFLFSAVCAFALIGCGDSNIDIVKNATLDINKTMTIGAAIDGYKQCESVKWKDTSKDGQNIVTATCEIKKEILEKKAKEKFDKFDKQFYQECTEDYYDYIKSQLEYSSKTPVKIPNKQEILELVKKHCKLNENEKDSRGKCDKSIYEDLKKFNYESERDKSLEILLIDFLDCSQKSISPKKVKPTSLNVNFFVNTDKSVSFKNAFTIYDGKEETPSNDVRELSIFYER